MKLSELIKEAQKVLEQHGDVDVVLEAWCDGEGIVKPQISSVDVVRGECIVSGL